MTEIKICNAPGCTSPRDKKQRSSLCTMHRVRRSRHKSYELPEKPSLPEGIEMICQSHGELHKDKTYLNIKHGYPQCIRCKKIAMQKFKEKNPDIHHTMKRNFYFFGKQIPKLKIKVLEYNELSLKQNHTCAICCKPETMKPAKSSKYERSDENKKVSKRLAIDHCHKVAKDGILKIRGLLCHHCNTMIGHANDDISILESAIAYLKKHE